LTFKRTKYNSYRLGEFFFPASKVTSTPALWIRFSSVHGPCRFQCPVPSARLQAYPAMVNDNTSLPFPPFTPSSCRPGSTPQLAFHIHARIAQQRILQNKARQASASPHSTGALITPNPQGEPQPDHLHRHRRQLLQCPATTPPPSRVSTPIRMMAPPECVPD
jgi:hypothetical protein